MGFFQVNYRKLLKAETAFIENSYEAKLFVRVTTGPKYYEAMQEIQVISFQLEMDDMGDISFTPMNTSVFRDEGLKLNGITHDYSSHRVNINKFYELLHDKFEIWNKTEKHQIENRVTTIFPQWRKIHSENLHLVTYY